MVYVKGIHAGDQYTKNLLTLRDFLADERLAELFDAEKIADHQRRLDYITHFAKWAGKPPTPRQFARRKKINAILNPSRRSKLMGRVDQVAYERRYGKRLELLEEREWRIVYHSTFKKYFTKPAPGPNRPDYFMPFTVGDDLFTVVLPDNKTLNLVMNDRFFVEKFYPEEGLHTTVLSLEDIGTF